MTDHIEPDTYIDPVTGADLAADKDTGDVNDGARRIIDAERTYIDRRRAAYGLAPSQETTALALSGGGIRSAAFALGVMQKLAAEDYLVKFDYLSTVSGGGYIGASLTWLTSKRFHQKSSVHFDVGPAFPYGVERPGSETPTGSSQNQKQFLTYLRSHGQYLIPGGGITLVSAIAVVLRGIFLNLIVWLPIAGILAAFLITVPHEGLHRWIPGCTQGLFCFTVTGVGTTPTVFHLPAGFAVIFMLALCGWLIMAALSIAYSFYAWAGRSPEARRYRARRLFERFAHWLLLWSIGLTIIGTIPWADSLISAKGGIVSFLGGVGGGLWSFAKSRSGTPGKVSQAVIAPIAALLLCYGFLILAYAIGDWSSHWLPTVAEGSAWPWAAWPLLLALVPFILIGGVTNLNYLTLHHYYRDRLMEAFMPDIANVEQNASGAARVADPAPLSAMCDGDDPRGPYHLINTNLVLTASKDRVRKTRGGDSFILSPGYCGSNATGWRATREFLGDRLTLATAMAISGAAANPSAGSGGVGVTRNPVVSVVMSLLNVRLGYWITHPDPHRARTKRRPNHFEPGLVDLVDWKRDEDSWTLRLSDGGHFDNLGIYELVRRRVGLIVVSDAGADPDCAFADLTNAIARVEQDFGARIEFVDKPALGPLMPSIDLAFPRGERRPRRAYAKATITYADQSPGILIYLTTLLVDDLRLRLLGYISANPQFPDESTADQFFSEAQFEAYRELGYCITARMLDDTMIENGGAESPKFRTVFDGRLKTGAGAGGKGTRPTTKV